jgi:hypothetical protein
MGRVFIDKPTVPQLLKKFLIFVWNPSVYYHVKRNLQVVPILNHINLVHNNKKTEKRPPLPTARDRLTGQEIGGPPTPSKGILTVNFNILFFIFL